MKIKYETSGNWLFTFRMKVFVWMLTLVMKTLPNGANVQMDIDYEPNI